MDQSNFPKSDPSILLLNEIEILLAQTRLMEIYLEQAQATAASEAARVNERHQAELPTLRAVLAAKENMPPIVAPDPEITQRLETIESELDANRLLLDQRDCEHASAEADAARLRGAIAELEMARQQAQTAALESAGARQSLQTELASLRQELEAKQHEFAQRQRDAQEIEQALRRQLTQLQSDLNDKQSGSQNATSEIEQSRNEIVALRARVAELDARRQEAQSSAAHKLGLTRSRFEAELGQLRTALAGRVGAEQQSRSSLAQIEANLKSEMVALKNQLEQKLQQLESRDGEWRQAQRELAALNRRVAGLDDVNRQAAAGKEAFEKAKQSDEHELAELHHEIAVKDRELNQRYEAVTGVELALHSKIQALQQEVARSHNEGASQENELNRRRDEIAKLEAHIRELESSREQVEASGKRFVEETRQRVEDQLNRLHASLAQKEYALKERENADKIAQDQLSSETHQLRNLLEEQRKSFEAAKAELTLAQAKVAALNESYRQQYRTLESQLAQARSGADALRLQTQELERLASQRETELKVKNQYLESASVQASGLQTRLVELESQLAQEQTRANDLRLQTQELERQVTQREAELKEKSASLESAQALASGFQNRLSELESQLEKYQATAGETDQDRSALATELASLRQELQQKSWTIAQQQAAVENLGLAHREQFHKLEGQVNEQRNVANARAADLESAQAQAEALRRRVGELEIALRRAEHTALDHAEKMRQDHAARHQEITSALQQKTTAIAEHGAAQANLEQSLRAEIDRLVREVGERNQILQNRNDELVRVKAEMDTIHERFLQLESSASQSDAAAQSETERMRTEFQAQLALLQAELSQKQWALEERHATASGMEQEFRQEIETLRKQVAEQAKISAPDADGFVMGDAELSLAQRDRAAKLQQIVDGARIDARNPGADSQGRRWRSDFARKRRWKA